MVCFQSRAFVVALLALIVVTSACSGGIVHPTSPSLTVPTTSGNQRVIRIVSGETFQPVAGAKVTLRATVPEIKVSDDDGRVVFDNATRTSPITIETEGFLTRETVLEEQEEFSLWPVRAGFTAEFTQALIYGNLSTLMRPVNSTIDLAFAPELVNNARVISVHRDAANMLMEAFNNHVRPPAVPFKVVLIGIDGVTLGGGAAFSISVGSETGMRTSRGSNIIGGSMIYSSVAQAQIQLVALRKLLFASGLSFSDLSDGVMKNDPTTSVMGFSTAEKLLLRLSLLRQPGNRFPDTGQ